MKVLICMLVTLAAAALGRPDKYSDQYDSVNLDEILPNDRLRQPYYKCLMDEVPCMGDAKELKSHIREALEDGCAKCSAVHLAAVKKVAKYLINNKPEEWNALCSKYDPDQKYRKKYEKELKELKN